MKDLFDDSGASQGELTILIITIHRLLETEWSALRLVGAVSTGLRPPGWAGSHKANTEDTMQFADTSGRRCFAYDLYADEKLGSPTD